MEKIQPNKLNNEQKFSMRTRIITALVLAAVVVPSIFIGNFFFFIVVLFFTVAAAVEIAKVSKIKGKIKPVIYALSIISMLALVYYVFLKNIFCSLEAGVEITFDNFLYTNLFEINISEMIMILVVGMFFFISFLTEEVSVSNVFYLVCMILICSLGFQSVMYLRYSPFEAFRPILGEDGISTNVFKYAQSAFLLLYLAIGVLMNDMGAYFVGVFFGKHKMNPRISPKKTWEGFAGGIAISMLCSLSFALILSAFGLDIHPALNLKHWYLVLAVSILMPLLGCVGDFVFSAVKRSFGVKDYSNIFPGHGGVLDRIDSILFSSALVAGMLVFANFVGVI